MNLIGRKDVTNTLTKKAPNTIDINMQSRLNGLKKNLIFFNLNNNNNNNNINDNNNLPSPPKQDNFFQPSFPPQQTTPKQNFFCTSTKNTAPRYQHCGYQLMIIF